MNNVASIDKIMYSAGAFLPCIRILRALDIASRQQRANFALHISFSYPSAGVVVTTPSTTVLVAATTQVVGVGDPVWQDVMPPTIPAGAAPDAGANITCNVKMTITQPVSNIVFDAGYLDTAILPQSATGW